MLDFIQAYNAYALGQVYFQNGRYTEAIVEYERSLERYGHLDEIARALLREQYGLSQELIEGELTLARAMMREQNPTKGDPPAEATQSGK
jgi:tetratricopeptide (TPR) repeat protein